MRGENYSMATAKTSSCSSSTADRDVRFITPPPAKVVVIPSYLDPNVLIREHPFRNPYGKDNPQKVIDYMSLIIGVISDRYFLSNYNKDKLHIPQFIKCEVFRNITQDYSHYLNYLIDIGFLKQYPYRVDYYTKSYSFIPVNFSWYLKTLYVTGKHAEKQLKQSVCVESIKMYPYLHLGVQEVNFDMVNARKLLASRPFNIESMEYKRQFCKLQSIDTNRIFKVDDKVGRLHTSFTNLRSDYRQFLSFNGNKLVNVDLKNSQPFFLACLMTNDTWDNFNVIDHILNYSPTLRAAGGNRVDFIMNQYLKKDIILDTYRFDFIQLVTSGLLYETICDSIDSIDNRSEAKDLVFKFLFSPLWYDGSIVEYFHLNFPLIDRFRRSLNVGFIKTKAQGRGPCEQSNTLALLLQKLESSFILDIVSPIINEKLDIPCLTIHDSFMVEEKHGHDVKEIIQMAAKDVFRIVPEIKIENFRKN